MAEHVNPFADKMQAADYDSWYETSLGRMADRLQGALVERMAQPRSGERVLDVGTGTGHYAVRLAARGLHVAGVDASESMLALARAKTAAVEWRQAEAEHLPFPDDSFDLVLAVTLLEFVPDPLQALAEMRRVAAPGGRLVLGVLNAHSVWGRFYRAQAQQMETPFRHAHLFTPAEFVTMLRHFGSVRWCSALFVPPSGRGLWAASLLEWLGRWFWRGHGALLVGRIDR